MTCERRSAAMPVDEDSRTAKPARRRRTWTGWTSGAPPALARARRGGSCARCYPRSSRPPRSWARQLATDRPQVLSRAEPDGGARSAPNARRRTGMERLDSLSRVHGLMASLGSHGWGWRWAQPWCAGRRSVVVGEELPSVAWSRRRSSGSLTAPPLPVVCSGTSVDRNGCSPVRQVPPLLERWGVLD